MKRTLRLFILPVLILITMTACSTLFPTKINKILNNPRDYDEKKVTISGIVDNTFSLILVKYFTLKDDTGEMAVVTQRPLPVKGTSIKVTGTVKEAFSLGDQQMIVLIED